MSTLKVKVLYTVLIFFTLIFSQVAMADDPPPPPPPGGGHGATGNQGPLSVPLYSGIAVFLAFAAVYGGREWYKSRANSADVPVQE